jgi:hypothetical protein
MNWLTVALRSKTAKTIAAAAISGGLPVLQDAFIKKQEFDLQTIYHFACGAVIGVLLLWMNPPKDSNVLTVEVTPPVIDPVQPVPVIAVITPADISEPSK